MSVLLKKMTWSTYLDREIHGSALLTLSATMENDQHLRICASHSALICLQSMRIVRYNLEAEPGNG